MDTSAERVAKNDATFRDANERISATALAAEMDAPIPFLCECADERCTEIVRLPLTEYERVRRDSTWFINAPGHDGSGGPHVRVVSQRDGYAIVEKVGRAAEVAAELDPREGAPG